MTIPVEVRTALMMLLLHGSPVTEWEYRKLAREADVTVTTGYLMMQGYVTLNREKENRNGWVNEFELSERGLEALNE